MNRRLLREVGTCVAALLLASFCGELSYGQEVSVIVSSKGGERLRRRSPSHFEMISGPQTNAFQINEKAIRQTMAGFGASFLEAGLICLNRLPLEGQEEVLRALFDPGDGAGFSVMKTPLAGTDFMSAGPYYTYNDTREDIGMNHFSIARDLEPNGLITFIRRARRYGNFSLQAPMDYPPDWMLVDVRTNQDVNPKYYDALALYYLRYLQEYKKQGIIIDYLSLFNEPGVYTKIPYPKIRELLKNHVAPLLARSGLKTRLMFAEAPCRECSWNEYPVILDDRETRTIVGALAYHGYNFNTFGAIARLHARYPELPLWMTEICHSAIAGTHKKMNLPRYDFDDGDFWGQQIFSDIEAGASAWIYWNMILDETGGPWLVSTAHADPDNNVQHPVVIINRDTHQVTYTGCYYYLAHFSKFVRPGAVCLGVSGTIKDARCVAFKTTDGGFVAELINSRDAANEVHLNCDGRALSLVLPPLSIATCVWSPGVGAIHAEGR